MASMARRQQRHKDAAQKRGERHEEKAAQARAKAPTVRAKRSVGRVAFRGVLVGAMLALVLFLFSSVLTIPGIVVKKKGRPLPP